MLRPLKHLNAIYKTFLIILMKVFEAKKLFQTFCYGFFKISLSLNQPLYCFKKDLLIDFKSIQDVLLSAF